MVQDKRYTRRTRRACLLAAALDTAPLRADSPWGWIPQAPSPEALGGPPMTSGTAFPEIPRPPRQAPTGGLRLIHAIPPTPARREPKISAIFRDFSVVPWLTNDGETTY